MVRNPLSETEDCIVLVFRLFRAPTSQGLAGMEGLLCLGLWVVWFWGSTSVYLFSSGSYNTPFQPGVLSRLQYLSDDIP